MPTVLPGDLLCLPSSSSLSSSSSSSWPASSPSSAIRLGPGLVYPSAKARSSHPGQILVTRAGLLGTVDDKTKGRDKDHRGQGWWVEGHATRYIPCLGDPIIGQVTAKNAESYTLSLGSSHSATLSVLAFEGATKRHRPNLKIGAMVYAQVTSAESWMEPEVMCVDEHTGKGNGLGELENKAGLSIVVEVTLGLAKSLLRPSHPLLPLLSSHFPLETAIGANGHVWLHVDKPQHLLAAKLVLEAADALGSGGVEELQAGDIDDLHHHHERKAGDWGKKLSAGWGRLGEREVARIVKSVGVAM